MTSLARSFAILNPLGDFGINQHCHELAEGLGINGARVVFYTGSANGLPPPKHHERLPVLNSLLFKQRLSADGPQEPVAGGAHSAQWIREAMSARPVDSPASLELQNGGSPVRKWMLTVELVVHLKMAGYGVVWTHWPVMDSYSSAFWPLCRRLGLKVVHSVHNVTPHEDGAEPPASEETIYSNSDLLVVHSDAARAQFEERYPRFAHKVIVLHAGLYTIYPRCPEMRNPVRAELGIEAGQTAILCCGAIRPYKNVDSVLEALSDTRLKSAVLVVAGKEAHFEDMVKGDPLGRTRRLAKSIGVEDRVRLIPRHQSIREMAELLEAGDAMVLPYAKGSGSGLLLLGMTFGKYILSTRTFGAVEYLEGYRPYAFLNEPTASAVADGLAGAIRAANPAGLPSLPPGLDWSGIARETIRQTDRLFAESGETGGED